MNVAKMLLSCFAVLGLFDPVCAENASKVAVPSYEDKYSQFVKQLEAGQTNIDYTEFRQSFLESEQFRAASEKQIDLSTLRQTMHELMRKSQYADIIAVTKKMLSIDYTDMEAHKILGDTVNRNKYHDIEFGLLNSIVRKGDGKSCQTAWPVIQVTEEYFILDMLGAKLLRQSVDNTSGLCDRMEAQTDQGKRTFYFEISKVMEGYKRQGIN